jgi:hypothetical protein
MGWASAILHWNGLILPLLPLAVVGACVIVHELAQRTEDPGRRHRGLLFIWLLIATGLWTAHGATGGGAAPVAQFWTIMLILPLSMSAGVGLLAVIDRSVPFYATLGIGAITLVDLAWIVSQARSLPGASELGLSRVSGWLTVACLNCGVLAGIAVVARSSSSETWRRGLLSGIVAGIVAAHATWGLVAVRRSNVGDHELNDLRSGFARVVDVTQWTLIVPRSPSGPVAEPPAQLVYTLRSLWPDIEPARADSWEQLVEQLGADRPEDARGRHLIIACSAYGRVRPTIPAGLLKAAAPPYIYRNYEVAAYVPGDLSP